MAALNTNTGHHKHIILSADFDFTPLLDQNKFTLTIHTHSTTICETSPDLFCVAPGRCRVHTPTAGAYAPLRGFAPPAAAPWIFTGPDHPAGIQDPGNCAPQGGASGATRWLGVWVPHGGWAVGATKLCVECKNTVKVSIGKFSKVSKVRDSFESARSLPSLTAIDAVVWLTLAVMRFLCLHISGQPDRQYAGLQQAARRQR